MRLEAKMNKKEWNKLLNEATKEFKEETRERVKELIKERLKEYELAKVTVKRIEKQMKQLKDKGIDSPLLLEYDGE